MAEMMEHRVCPGCGRAFYASSGVSSLRCPHCRFVVLDGRPSKRIKKSLDLTFSTGGESVRARLVDYSEGGVRIAYTGRALEVDTLIDLDIEKLHIRRTALAVWTKRIEGAVSTGFKFI